MSVKNPIQDPCLAKGFGDEIPSPIPDPSVYNIEEAYRAQLSGAPSLFVLGTGEWDKCYESLKEFTKNRYDVEIFSQESLDVNHNFLEGV